MTHVGLPAVEDFIRNVATQTQVERLELLLQERKTALAENDAEAFLRRMANATRAVS